jgi:hypothetical protein
MDGDYPCRCLSVQILHFCTRIHMLAFSSIKMRDKLH